MDYHLEKQLFYRSGNFKMQFVGLFGQNCRNILSLTLTPIYVTLTQNVFFNDAARKLELSCEMIERLKEAWQTTFALEPVVFAFVFSNFLANGAQQNTNLLLKKVCRDKVGYNFSLCLDHQSDPVIHLEVLREANKYSLYLDLVGILPAVFYVIIGGALSDQVRFVI